VTVDACEMLLRNEAGINQWPHSAAKPAPPLFLFASKAAVTDNDAS
jgi:hypothetical protein